MASSGAARPTLQRVLRQTCSGSLSGSRPASLLPLRLLPHTQARHATRATIAKAKAKAEALARQLDPAARTSRARPAAARPRPNRDQNRQRGLSAMRQTGPRERLSVSGLPLPRPVAAADFPAVPTDPAHGLWGFFHSHRRPLNTPREDRAHGRAWTVEELRRKGWGDLHRLWWVCVKERNRIATGNAERKKGGYGYGAVESRGREMEVRKTQNAIKHALTERFYAWEDAVELAKKDPAFTFTEHSVTYKVPKKMIVEAQDQHQPEDHDKIWVEEGGDEAEAKAVDPSIPNKAVNTQQQDAPRA